MQIIPEHLTLSREDVRKEDEFKDLTYGLVWRQLYNGYLLLKLRYSTYQL
jgi:hypothetical protein